MQTKMLPMKVNALGDRKMSFVISTNSLDRDLDTIDLQGWDLRSYERNPIVLWNHDPSQPPIGRATRIWSDSRGLNSEVEFPPTGTYPFADMICGLVKSGFLNACSVGFIPLGDVQPNGLGGHSIRSAELLEFSVVSVPSNRDALVTQRSTNMQALKSWFGDSGDQIDWDRIGTQLATKTDESVEVDISEADVIRCMTALIPALREGLKTGLRMQAEAATDAVICRMTGRLD